jgi:hypothetical protein
MGVKIPEHHVGRDRENRPCEDAVERACFAGEVLLYS